MCRRLGELKDWSMESVDLQWWSEKERRFDSLQIWSMEEFVVFVIRIAVDLRSKLTMPTDGRKDLWPAKIFEQAKLSTSILLFRSPITSCALYGI